MPLIAEAAEESPYSVQVETIGQSRAGRDLYGITAGDGPVSVSLIAGAHADEPVGPETLRTLLLAMSEQSAAMDALLSACTLSIIPHINPDGEERNRPWMEDWPSLQTYLKRRVREKPGEDLEFGFPGMRPENRAVSSFLRARGPFHLHLSLHGMGLSAGFFLLIERRWGFRTTELQSSLLQLADSHGLALHDHNRKGEKGFFYLGAGFNTTPEGTAMRTFFDSKGDPAMARRFHMSSMEFVRSLGGGPLCLVTELPLFVMGKEEKGTPENPETYLACRTALEDAILSGDGSVEQVEEQFQIRPMLLPTAVSIQLAVIEEGVRTVSEALPA